LGWQGQGFGVQQITRKDVWDESSKGSGEAMMPVPKLIDGDYCAPGEPREVRKPRPNGNEGLNAKVCRMLTDIGVEMGDPCCNVVFCLLIKGV